MKLVFSNLHCINNSFDLARSNQGICLKGPTQQRSQSPSRHPVVMEWSGNGRSDRYRLLSRLSIRLALDKSSLDISSFDKSSLDKSSLDKSFDLAAMGCMRFCRERAHVLHMVAFALHTISVTIPSARLEQGTCRQQMENEQASWCTIGTPSTKIH